jgi:hypothetical protein
LGQRAVISNIGVKLAWISLWDNSPLGKGTGNDLFIEFRPYPVVFQAVTWSVPICPVLSSTIAVKAGEREIGVVVRSKVL